VEYLFSRFNKHLIKAGYLAMKRKVWADGFISGVRGKKPGGNRILGRSA